MTISEIYENYSIGSEGFCIAVENHCGFDASRSEIERIAAVSTTPDQFESVWTNSDSWTDERNS